MRKHKTLVHAPVIEDYLLGQDNERIEYLELPGDPEEYSIDDDIRFTAFHGFKKQFHSDKYIGLC